MFIDRQFYNKVTQAKGDKKTIGMLIEDGRYQLAADSIFETLNRACCLWLRAGVFLPFKDGAEIGRANAGKFKMIKEAGAGNELM